MGSGSRYYPLFYFEVLREEENKHWARLWGEKLGSRKGTVRFYNFWWQLCYICIEVEMGWLQEGEDRFMCCPFMRVKSSSSSPASLVPTYCIIFSAVSWPPCQGCNDQQRHAFLKKGFKAYILSFPVSGFLQPPSQTIYELFLSW